MDQVDLLEIFTSSEDGISRHRALEKLLIALNEEESAEVTFLALQRLFDINKEVNNLPFDEAVVENLRGILRKWRCDTPLRGAYQNNASVCGFLRRLQIFKELKVPLFIDDYGHKKLLGDYNETEDIRIDFSRTPIVHVTHDEQANSIKDANMFQASSKKNIIEGTWFSLRNRGSSIFGSYAFRTTLAKLGVTGLHQGEIVFYKQEVNVILCASETNGVIKKPTTKAVQSEHGPNAYVLISIFVPERFLPQEADEFKRAVEGPYKVKHDTFCVPELRSPSGWKCKELIRR